VVTDQTAAAVHSTQYYPFGMAFAISMGQNGQRFKYNDKELDLMHGLNMYDYSARHIDKGNPRFTTQDPLAEKYYSISPYAYCGNNPVNYIDPTGMDSTYFNSQGDIIYSCGDDPNVNKYYVTKTTTTTSEMYPDPGSQNGTVQSITPEAAENTENEIQNGNVTGSHMQNVTQIESPDRMTAMINSIGDEGNGGTNSANNREYSGYFGGRSGVRNTATSNSGRPSQRQPLRTETIEGADFHSHPSGTERFTINGQSYTGSWQQPPSRQDINVSSNRNQYVVGMGTGLIYVYNRRGVVATIPIATFK
jgi:RHS repeat-associated protein